MNKQLILDHSLRFACRNGNLNQVISLIKRGANAFFDITNHLTCIELAIKRLNIPVIKYLLTYGAPTEYYILSRCININNPQIIDILSNNYVGSISRNTHLLYNSMRRKDTAVYEFMLNMIINYDTGQITNNTIAEALRNRLNINKMITCMLNNQTTCSTPSTHLYHLGNIVFSNGTKYDILIYLQRVYSLSNICVNCYSCLPTLFNDNLFSVNSLLICKLLFEFKSNNYQTAVFNLSCKYSYLYILCDYLNNDLINHILNMVIQL